MSFSIWNPIRWLNALKRRQPAKPAPGNERTRRAKAIPVRARKSRHRHGAFSEMP